MSFKRNEESKQVSDQTKKSPTTNTTQKERDSIVPAKDISPDDLEHSRLIGLHWPNRIIGRITWRTCKEVSTTL